MRLITSNIEDAGTESRVWIKVLGEKGVIGKTELDIVNDDDRRQGR